MSAYEGMLVTTIFRPLTSRLNQLRPPTLATLQCVHLNFQHKNYHDRWSLGCLVKPKKIDFSFPTDVC